MLPGIGSSRGQQLPLPFGHERFVLAMRRHDHSQFPREFQGVIQFRVVDPKGSLVGEEDFEGTDSAPHDFPQLRRGVSLELRYPHVKGEITGGFSHRLVHPNFETGERVVRPGRTAHFNEGGGAAHQRGPAAGDIRVLGLRPHEGQMNMDMRIDEPGEDILAAGVDDLRAGRDWQLAPDAGDGVLLTPDVRHIAFAGGDDFAVFDQE